MSVISSDLACSQAGCPFPGRCLEGFDDLTACPYTVAAATDRVELDADAGVAESEGEEPRESGILGGQGEEFGTQEVRSDGPGAPVALVDLVGAESLTMNEAGPIMRRERCRVVLVAGDAKAGKTTLVVELYARFLTGPFNEWSFAGSVTLRALDVRHYTAQAASGGSQPYTVRTQDEDMRLLHLHLARGNDNKHLLFSDVRGEFFDDVVDGAPVSENVQIAPRADRCIVTIDGERIADPRTAETAFLRAQCLVGGLLAKGGLDVGVPILIVCTKWDRVPEERRPVVLRDAESLASFARKDGRAVQVQPLSVRPGPPISELSGLSELLEWLVSPATLPVGTMTLTLPVGRQFWGPGGAR